MLRVQTRSNMAGLLLVQLQQRQRPVLAGSAAAFTVYEQQPEEVTALAAQLLPAAALAPGAVLDRLLADAVLHSGQVIWARASTICRSHNTVQGHERCLFIYADVCVMRQSSAWRRLCSTDLQP